MTSRSLGLLGLRAEQAGTAADFHEAYGRLVEPDQENADFKALVEAASAYRLAGQWRWLVEQDAGVELLLHAASLFTRAGLTYGAYLSASLAPVSHGDQLDSWVERLLRTAGQRHRESEPLVELGLEDHRPDDILGHVQQQAYLLLACALLTTPGSPQATELRSFATESPHRDGVVPMGSMAMPVRTFWGLAVDMLSPEDSEAARRYADTLAELSRAYARTVGLAMANTLTWSNGAAPIDVADLDVIGTTAMGTRHFGRRRMRVLLATAELPDLALVPLDLGLEVVDVPDPPDPDPSGLRRDRLEVDDLAPDGLDPDLTWGRRNWGHLDPDRTELGDPDDGLDPDGSDGGLDL
ncbi:hypothetical protein ACFY6U_50025 [Streptomyces sp. NPDC013157]|uniref:hypothetical protein n=1 Tax=Streptomyces sp. NPDC013157 TaxID=3364861 RepID=UPI0036B3052F